MKGVVYTGGGYGGSRPGIPARDLTPEEVEEFGGPELLVGTGLYEVENDSDGRSREEDEWQE